MDGLTLLDTILPLWRTAAASAVEPAYFDAFIERNRAEILALLTDWHARRTARRPPAGPASSLEAPPDEWTPAQRAKANLAAMRLVATRAHAEITDADRRALLRYSGWGGLSIDKYKAEFPEGWDPDAFGLVHEYYTPTRIARAIAGALCDFLPGLAARDGTIHALEPSAGIGRIILALDQATCAHPPIRWTAIELSTVAARMLPLLFPSADVHAMSFEEWLHRQTARPDRATPALQASPRDAGKIQLLVSNPPYGKRGISAKFDQSPEYAEREAFAYFLRRGLDLLAPFGIGVFLIPAGFLTGQSAPRRDLRDRVLRRHHLMGAFRLPSEIFPGANLVTDLLFFRARGGELAEVDEADRFIHDGSYFDEFPGHILGKEEGRGAEDDDLDRPKGRHRVTGDLTPLLATAVILDHRVADYLAERAQGSARAVELWPELLQSLRDFQRAPEVTDNALQNPWAWMELRALAEQDNPGAQSFLNAFTKAGDLTDAITTRPTVEERFRGDPGDLLAQADFLYRSRRRITIDDLLTFHREQGGDLDRPALLARLFRADWCVDGPDLRELVPLADYVTGDLWPKLDRLDAERGHASIDVTQISLQRARLLAAIRPIELDDLTDLSPADGYLPLPLVADFLSQVINHRYGAVALERQGGVIQIAGEDYATLSSAAISPEALWFVGWLNHDNTYFTPRDLHRDDPEADRVRADAGLDELKIWDFRRSHERAWKRTFDVWLRADDSRRQRVRDAYNRAHRRFVRRTCSNEPLGIARWGDAVTLAPHQNAAARRVLDARGGLVAFDVGVGKTYTGLAILARARQDGWGRRPVVLVPSSLVWKWYRDFQRCLPDYRVAVIGSKRTRLTRGERHKDASERLARGELTRPQFEQAVTVARPDSAQERAGKWSAFQAGLYDAVILSYTALDRSAVDLDSILAYAENTPAIQRVLSLQERNDAKRKKPKKVTERKKAIAETGVKAFVLERLEIAETRDLDPGIRWEDLGIDLLLVDEAQNFKNLYAPEPREGGTPKFMGLPQGGSKRAWQLDFRASFVRRRTGGSGVVLLSATPAKNSPLEFYNVLQYVDHDAFTKVGIHDPEEFVDRYLKIEPRDVLDANFDVVRKSAVVGFQRLDELRDVLDRYAEFRTAEEVGIRLPLPRVQRVDVAMDDHQEAKYDAIVRAMTERLEKLLKGEATNSAAILGDMVRLALIALHGDLDEGYDWDTALEGGLARRKVSLSALEKWIDRGWAVLGTNAEKETADIQRDLPRPDPRAPKFQAVAERIAAQPGCGHIVFCEPVACHRWLVEVLVDNGIPRERIAVMNAAATDTAARITIADGFNGDPEAGDDPIYDVVIANSVAYEGVDLQTRTCAIHHLDLPWTPADLEQRNGRAYRQGNTLGTIEILYYIAQGSMDGFRFSVIHGKRGWLTDLLASQNRDTNNPAAQQDFSPEELLEYIARDKSGVRELLAKRKAQKEAEARARQAQAASLLLRQAVGRYRDARRLHAQSPERAAQLRAEADDRLADLRRVAADIWPWTKWIDAFREVDGLVPSDGSAPVFEGLRAAPPAGAVEFGQVRDTASGPQIGMRRAGEAHWRLVGLPEIAALQLRPEHLQAPWPDDDDERTDLAMTAAIARLDTWRTLGWEGASEAFRQRWWSRRGKAIAEALARRGDDKERLPILSQGTLFLKAGPALRDGQLLPPTAEGWERLLKLAPASGEPYTALRDVGERWWGRKIPQNLLAAAAEPQDDETALSLLLRQLHAAKEAHTLPPRDLVGWLHDHELAAAADLLDGYLDDSTQPLDDFLRDLRQQLLDGLERSFATQDALDYEGHLNIDATVLHVDPEGTPYVLAFAPGEPTRRVLLHPPAAPSPLYTIKSGALSKVDRLWDTSHRYGRARSDEGRAALIEEVWRRYAGLARGLELAPAFLHEARDLLAIAGEAIQSPLCTGRERDDAIAALRLAKKYFDRARDRILLGRPAHALDALRRLIDRLTESAAIVARACGVGQRSLTPSRVLIPSDDRRDLAHHGDDIVDLIDTDLAAADTTAPSPAEEGAAP